VVAQILAQERHLDRFRQAICQGSWAAGRAGLPTPWADQPCPQVVLHFGRAALADQADTQHFTVWPAGMHLYHGCGVQDKSDNCRCLISKDE
jgi:hypothetical protein